MNTDKLTKYIFENIKKGFFLDEIECTCSEGGWTEKEIASARIEAEILIQKERKKGLKPAPKRGKVNFDLKKIGLTQIFLFLGGGIIFIAGLIFIGINWGEWNSIIRIMVVLVPMISISGIGMKWYLKNEYKKVGLAFIVTGSLLFPIFLLVLFHELDIFEGIEDYNLGITVSLLSLILYVIFSYKFKNALWTLLYSSAGYAFFNSLIMKAGYTESDEMAGVFFTLALIYAGIGIIHETRSKIWQSRILYFFGFVIGIISLVVLAGHGSFIELFGVETDKEGLSFVLVAIFYLGLGYGLEKINDTRLKNICWYSRVLLPLGMVILPLSFLILGFNGSEPFYETMVLVVSLVFIFSSPLRKSNLFLYGGTLFLIIYIFSIGGEYFQNDVGWPLTLLGAGIISMLIGYGIERFKKSGYFDKIEK